MDDLVDGFDFPIETRLRLRMLESKRRSRHLMLRGIAVVMLLAFMGLAVGVQQVPHLVDQMLAPLQQVTQTLNGVIH